MPTYSRARPLLAVLILLGPVPARAASANSMATTGTAAATLLAPLTLSHGGGDLRFGTFFPGTGGTVIVDAAGNATTTGTVLMWNGTPPRADRFAVTGSPLAGVSIVTGSGTVTSGAASMGFTTAPGTATITLDAAGHAGFDVGGTITAPGGTPKGNYSGSYTVSVAYD
ncbi:MAG: DUF4402 domain-containing protein [Sphingomonadales bacterium]|nr:DUF4402 domain-containing protein [Sphingomonadales bacterium]